VREKPHVSTADSMESPWVSNKDRTCCKGRVASHWPSCFIGQRTQ